MMTMPILIESAVTPRNDAVSCGVAVVVVLPPPPVDFLLLPHAANTSAISSSPAINERFLVMPSPCSPGRRPVPGLTVRPSVPAIHDSGVRFVTVTP